MAVLTKSMGRIQQGHSSDSGSEIQLCVMTAWLKDILSLAVLSDWSKADLIPGFHDVNDQENIFPWTRHVTGLRLLKTISPSEHHHWFKVDSLNMSWSIPPEVVSYPSHVPGINSLLIHL